MARTADPTTPRPPRRSPRRQLASWAATDPQRAIRALALLAAGHGVRMTVKVIKMSDLL